MWNRTRRGLLAGAGICVVACAMCFGSDLTEQELRWLDRRIPNDERAVLDSTIGYSLPELVGRVESSGGEPIDFEALRGRVVVLQSWTRKTAAGRAAPKRLNMLLEEFDPEDVAIVSIHTPDGVDGLDGYLEKRDVGIPVLIDYDGFFCDDMGIYKRPLIIAIDRQGTIRYPGLGMAGVRDAVSHLVAESYDPSAAQAPTLPARDEQDISRDGNSDASQASGFPEIEGGVGRAADLRGKEGPSFRGIQFVTPRPTTQGKVVMLDLWATWCAPCRESIPKLNQLASKHEDALTIIGISREDKAKVVGFMRKTRMQYAIALDPGGIVSSQVRNETIPHAIIMSPDGIVRWQGNPYLMDVRTVQQIIDASGISSPAGATGTTKNRWTTEPRPSASPQPAE